MKTFKVEAVCPIAFETYADGATLLPPFIEDVYNRRRLHLALGYLNQFLVDDCDQELANDLWRECRGCVDRSGFGGLSWRLGCTRLRLSMLAIG